MTCGHSLFASKPSPHKTGYQPPVALEPPAGQENAPNPAQKALRSSSRQKKASFPAQNGIPPACRAGKCPKSCAEGAPWQFQAEKGIFSGSGSNKKAAMQPLSMWSISDSNRSPLDCQSNALAR